MEEYKKKSFGTKVLENKVLNESTKPYKQLPSTPYLRSVEKPNLTSSYDLAILASTNLKLEGYENAPENAVKIEVTLNGFEYTEPVQLSEQKQMTSISNGKSSNYTATYYHTEFTYRHVMTVKVTSPDGKELFAAAPKEFSTYTTFKTPESTTASPINKEALIKSSDDKILQANLTVIYNLVNDKFGFKPTERKTALYYVKSKDEAYKDILVAFNDASFGLKNLIDDKETAKSKITGAIQLFQNALKLSEPENKKAVIDKGVTIALCFDVLESYFALGDYASADPIFSTLNALDLSNGDRKDKEKYQSLFSDLKKRKSAMN